MKSTYRPLLTSLLHVMTGLMLLTISLLMLSPLPALGQETAGYALQFDGVDDYVVLPDTPDIMAGDTWSTTKTVDLWVKPTGVATCTAVSPAHCDNIFGDRPRWWGISRGPILGSDRLWVWNYDVDGDLQSIPIDYNVGEWVHITLVHGSGMLTAYKNGILVDGVTSGPTGQPSNQVQIPNLQIGGIINNVTRTWTFEGLIDEVRVWNTALDQATIQAWMDQEVVTATHPYSNNLAAYYQMSDGAGATLTDDSGNGWGGTFVNEYGIPPDGPQWVLSGAFNDRPIAYDQAVTTTEEVAIGITLTATDTNEVVLTYTIESDPENGVLTGAAPNITYTPNTDFSGTDAFNFSVNDGLDDSALATVTITVTNVNDPPVAVTDVVTTTEDVPVEIEVLDNDTDIDGDTLTIDNVGTPIHGNVISNTIVVTYTPDGDFNGTDSFTYTVADGQGGFDTAVVTVTVQAVNNPPVAVTDVVTTPEDVPVGINVLENDEDSDDEDTLTVYDVGTASHGNVISNTSVVTYTPVADFNGTDSFTYTVTDGNDGYDTAVVTVTVEAVNDLPVAGTDDVTTTEDVPVEIDVLENDEDSDDEDTLTVYDVGTASHGDVISNTSVVTYTPVANFNGTDSFTYTVTDGNDGYDTGVVTVTVDAVNDPPVAGDDEAETEAETAVTIDVLNNDINVEVGDGDVLTITLVGEADHGTVDNNDTDVTYTPDGGFSGTDTFTYTVSDSYDAIDTALVTVTVNEGSTFIYLPIIIASP